MIARKVIKQQLHNTLCYKCGSSLGEARLIELGNPSAGFVAHAVCPKCQAESVVSITSTGSGSVPLVSDLRGPELKKFIGRKSVTYDNLLDLHAALEKQSVWNLLHKPENDSVKKWPSSAKKEKSQP